MPIRPATGADLLAVARIYGHEVRAGVATFDLEPRPLEVWQERLESKEPGDHLLVADVDGEVTGYACSSPYRPKAGYRHTRETTIYLRPDAQVTASVADCTTTSSVGWSTTGSTSRWRRSPCPTRPAWPCTGPAGSTRWG